MSTQDAARLLSDTLASFGFDAQSDEQRAVVALVAEIERLRIAAEEQQDRAWEREEARDAGD